MNYAEEKVIDCINPKLVRVEHMFWRRFDIYPGIWKYRHRIGHIDWPTYNHHAETGKQFHAWSSKYKVMCFSQRLIAQAKSTMSLESRKGAA